MNDYPASFDVRPLTTWPGELLPWHKRQRSQFSAPLRSTLSALTRELSALGARHPVLEVAIPADQFRLDGRPRANAREEHPGIVLSLPHTNVGALRYATDTFTTWQDNLRAVALGLEALRKVDRYGITKRGEQYQGFKALPSGTGAIAMGGMTRDEALEIVQRLSAGSTSTTLSDRIRHAKANAHPDRNEGRRALWDELERAIAVLERDA